MNEIYKIGHFFIFPQKRVPAKVWMTEHNVHPLFKPFPYFILLAKM